MPGHTTRQDVITGETLCDEKAPIVLERMDFPDPVIKIAIEPKSKGDLEKMVRPPPPRSQAPVA